MLEFLDPTGHSSGNVIPTAPRVKEVNGLTVGLLDNGKTNAAKFLDMVAEILIERHGVKSAKMFQKEALSKPALAETLEALARESDFVVTGIGDCGSCSTNSVHDGIEIEKLGVPAVAVCTEAFRVGLDSLTRMRGMPDYKYAIVPHPLGVLFDDELRGRAELAASQIISILTDSGTDRP